MALCGKIVDLVGLVLLVEEVEGGGVREVAVVHAGGGVALMRVNVEIIDSGRIEGRGAPLDAVDRVAFFQQQTCEVSTVLACDPCNQSRLVRQATRLPLVI